MAWQPRLEMRLSDDYGRLGVLEDVLDALGGVVGIEGNVGAARLGDRQQPDEHVEGALDEEPHSHVRRHSQLPQMAGEGVGAAVEFAVGELAARGSWLVVRGL